MYELRLIRERRHGYGRLRPLTTSRDVYETFRNYFENLTREEILVLPLDARHVPAGFSVVSVGSLTASIVHPREVFKVLIVANAAAFICLHNHPSGDPTPSAEDVDITRRLREVGELVGIRLLDHIIIGDGRYFSFVDEGRM